MKQVIIAPYLMHKELLLKERKDTSFKQIKIFTREDILNQVFGEFSIESRIALIKELNITYDLADEIALFLPYIFQDTCKKINALLPIKNKLVEDGHYMRNHLLKVAFQNAEITIYGYSKKDSVLLEALKRIDVPYKFISNKVDIPYMDVHHFKKVEDEVLYVLNKIAQLIKKGVSPSDIYLYNVDETYAFYLEMYMKSFNLRINGLPTSSMYLTGYDSEFFKLFKENRDAKKSLEILEEEVGKDSGEDYQFTEFKEVINTYSFDDVSYEIQKDIYTSILKRKNLKSVYYKNGIKIINEPILNENKHIFVLNFALNIIPKVYKDDEYLSNLEKEGSFILKSNERNMIEKDLTLQFLNTNNHFYYSYSDRSISESYYPSSLISDTKKQLIRTTLDSEAFSQKMLDYLLSQKIDLFNKFRENSKEYRALLKASDISSLHNTYDNSFTGVNAVSKDQFFRHSFSSIDSYYECPFKYYLSHILKFDEYSQSFDAIVGSIVHEVLVGVYDKDYNLEKKFEEEVKKYPLSSLEKLHLDNVKKHLEKMYEILLEYYDQNRPSRSVLYEKEVTINLNEHVSLFGKIDKILKLDHEHYIIVDYKSSAHKFEPKYLDYGLGMQLPLYYALASSLKELEEDKISGIYYHQFMDRKINPYINDEDYPDYLKLSGITICDNINLSTLDASLSSKGKSNFFDGVSITKENTEKFNDGKAATKKEIDSYRDYVINKVLEADERIRNNQFEIYTSYIDDMNNGCGFCKYQDICYLRRDKQINNIAQKIKEANNNTEEEAIEA
ncbi:MAG: PD-(D/E)XK nuclease family protein [Bacilli bacterium]|nr:PD-(D/E)XK nuclease family protein [Bacilli bacterium]